MQTYFLRHLPWMITTVLGISLTACSSTSSSSASTATAQTAATTQAQQACAVVIADPVFNPDINYYSALIVGIDEKPVPLQPRHQILPGEHRVKVVDLIDVDTLTISASERSYSYLNFTAEPNMSYSIAARFLKGDSEQYWQPVVWKKEPMTCSFTPYKEPEKFKADTPEMQPTIPLDESLQEVPKAPEVETPDASFSTSQAVAPALEIEDQPKSMLSSKLIQGHNEYMLAEQQEKDKDLSKGLSKGKTVIEAAHLEVQDKALQEPSEEKMMTPQNKAELVVQKQEQTIKPVYHETQEKLQHESLESESPAGQEQELDSEALAQ